MASQLLLKKAGVSMEPGLQPSHSPHVEDLDSYRAALMLIDNGEIRLAQNLLREQLIKNPKNIESIKWLAYCLQQSNDSQGALTCYKEIARLAPSEESYCDLAEANLKLNNRNLAMANYQLALSYIDFESPRLFEIYKNMGNIFLSAGDLDAAEEHYNRALTLRPHSDGLYVNYGTLEIQKQNYAGAIERFRQALELNQTNEKAWVGLAMSYYQMGDFELAWGAAERALDIDHVNTLALRLLIEWSFKQETYSSIIARLNSYLTSRPSDTDMAYSLAVVLFKAGQLLEAEFEIDKVLTFQPVREDAMELKKIILERLEAGNA
jgi:tetratricopeptide (TPR) repeat protein